MATKSAAELWVVILNEFTDAGLDALSVAQSARGTFDVRLVAGGCLCCVGELEFGKQIRDILRNVKPTRLLIEPSGAGHAADIIDELAVCASQGALSLDSVVCLIDPLDAERIWRNHGTNDWSQIQSADVLLLSKADIASDAARRTFAEIAAAQFPAKGFLGECTDGELPPEALHSYERPQSFTLAQPAAAQTAHPAEAFPIRGLAGIETRVDQLGFYAFAWILPPELTFSRVVIEPRANWLLQSNQGLLRRLKAVFRTGPGPSWMVQSTGRDLSAEDSAYRRDSRLELVLVTPPSPEYLHQWRALLRDAALPPKH
jgi:G3E family GTPase